MTGLDLYYSVANKLPKEHHWFLNWHIKLLTRHVKKPEISNEDLKLKFEKLNDEQLNEVAAKLPKAGILNPTKVFWLYNFIFGAFGVARFAIGHFNFGLFRIVFTLASIFIAQFAILNPYNSLLHILDVFFTGGGYGLWFVDLYIVGVILRNQNIEKINNILDEALAKGNV